MSGRIIRKSALLSGFQPGEEARCVLHRQPPILYNVSTMKIIAQLQLRPNPEQSAALLATLERVNAACDTISAVAWREQVFGQFPLHRLCYADVRAAFGLAAQLTVR